MQDKLSVKFTVNWRGFEKESRSILIQSKNDRGKAQKLNQLPQVGSDTVKVRIWQIFMFYKANWNPHLNVLIAHLCLTVSWRWLLRQVLFVVLAGNSNVAKTHGAERCNSYLQPTILTKW